ncbi:MAG: TylF/MycF/NovP-related O-methyltransferase [bacterium]
MMNRLKERIGKKLYRRYASRFRFLMNYPTYDRAMKKEILKSGDPIRYAFIACALARIVQENIDGAIAEVGVYQGETSRFIQQCIGARVLFLFDTFEGFPSGDLEISRDERFRKTNLDIVKTNLVDTTTAHLRKGYFPETTKGLEEKQFAFVLLDLDLYKPTLEGLKFFYPRVSPGGYIMLHDFNSPESGYAIQRAVKEFMQERQESIIDIPDRWGSAMFRKALKNQ